MYIAREFAKKRKNCGVFARFVLFLSGIQTELTTARKFLFAILCRNMKPPQVFAYANTVRKVLSEQGFDVYGMGKDEIKRLIALYFDASLTGENIPDYDGEQYFDLKKAE